MNLAIEHFLPAKVINAMQLTVFDLRNASPLNTIDYLEEKTPIVQLMGVPYK